jgi:hypothetical protein
MKHRTLYQSLLPLACACVAAYAAIAVDALRADFGVGVALSIAAVVAAWPLLRILRNRRTRSSWPLTLAGVAAGSIALLRGITPERLAPGALFLAVIEWLTVAGYAWLALGIIVGLGWLTVALVFWWRGNTGDYSAFADVLRDYGQWYLPGYIRVGISVAIGAVVGVLLSAIGALLAELPFASSVTTAPMRYLAHALVGAAAGTLAAAVHMLRYPHGRHPAQRMRAVAQSPSTPRPKRNRARS